MDATNTQVRGGSTPPWWAVIAAVLVAILAVAHVRRYYRGGDATIAQARLDAVTPALLAERRPLVVEDVLVSPGELAASPVFRWQHVWRSRAEPCDGKGTLATARFTLLYYEHGAGGDRGAGGDVVIEPPASAAAAGAAAVRLVPGRVIVLPPRWRYYGGTGLMRVRMHDPVSAILGRGQAP